MNGGTIYTQYLYNAEGLRVGKALISASAFPSQTAGTCPAPGAAAGFTLTNQYLLDLSGNQVTELDGSGNWKHSNVWVGSRLLATYANDGQDVHFHIADPVGTQRIQAGTTGSVEETCQSLPFGDDLS